VNSPNDVRPDDDADALIKRRVGALRDRTRRRSGSSVQAQRWSRLLHVYLSMIAFAVVLFFAITGVTLNHPEWTLGFGPTRTIRTGTLPAAAVQNGTVDWFTVSEYLRSAEDVRGSVADTRADDLEASIVFKGPAYEADATVRLADRSYTLTVESQGFLALVNDLHKGRDTRSSWRWLIDASGGFLAFVSFTGLTLQFFLRKRRRSAFVSAAIGTVVMVALIVVAIQ
jgi:uncharacterized protein